MSLRKVAAAAGASTMIIYTLFENKDGLLDALYARALGGMGDALATTQASDPLDGLVQLAFAYRRFAVDNPNLYRVVMDRLVNPTGTSSLRDGAGFQLLRQRVCECLDAGLLPPGQPDRVANMLFALVHGLASFEISGYFEDEAEALDHFHRASAAIIRGLATSGC